MQTLDPEVLALLAQEFIADAGQGIARMRQQLHATLGGPMMSFVAIMNCWRGCTMKSIKSEAPPGFAVSQASPTWPAILRLI